MSRQNIHILLAENRQPAINAIKAALTDHNDLKYSFNIARTGKDILEKTDSNKFDLVLMEQSLSDTDGIKVLDEINKRKLQTPVIIIVEENKENLGVEAMDKGAYDYLTRDEIKTAALNRAVRRAIQRKKLEDDIKESLKKLEKMAIRDGLTGLYNHNHFKEILKLEYKQAKRNILPLSCIMLDLDHFKSVNDTYGHQFGDFALVKSAEILKKLVRDTDFVARYGGEEFFIVLPNTNQAGAFILAERIRSAFEKNVFRKGDISRPVTVSVGISSTSDNNVAGDSDLIANADKALYRAKWRGRNNVCTYEETEFEKKVHIREEDEMIKDFSLKFENVHENIKETCIESAHNILRELSSGWDYINEHLVRVSRYVEKMTREMETPEEDAHVIKRAALLHDIGMVGINSKILKKKGRLTDEEYALVKRHANIGVKIIERTRLFHKELPIILHHHERFDGSGYPHKLKGENIPYGARLLAVAEAYDAMSSDTVYRKSCSSGKAVAELKSCAGKQFDPHIVDVFVRVVNKD
ncbi:MAG: diguanylate cyclase [Nitrospiraceae bacterium]|nr:MAG: diguanylate cyclase [Nitrospiraceae bacterium]